MKWEWVEPLKSEESIWEFEQLVDFSFPEDFKCCVKENNGAMPEKDVFDTEESEGRVFHHLYSFNRENEVNMWSMNWLDELDALEDLDDLDDEEDEIELEDYDKEDQAKYIAFASTPCGDDICFERSTGKIFLVFHEFSHAEFIANTFTEFIDSLYSDD